MGLQSVKGANQVQLWQLKSVCKYYRSFTNDGALPIETTIDRPGKPLYKNEEFAGEHFHEMALKVHKCICQDAIQACRPQMRKTLAEISSQSWMRMVLNDSNELDFEKRYAKQIEKKQDELNRAEQHIQDIVQSLEHYD